MFGFDFTFYKDAFSEFRMFREVHGLTVTRPHIRTSTLNALSDSVRLKEFHTLEGTVLVTYSTDSTDSTSIIALLPKALETLKVARVDREWAEWVLHAHRENKLAHTQKDPNTLITLTHHCYTIINQMIMRSI
ncbi:hypothetical protein NEIG_02591 [Nematocida sp. ERTm5]|nr:hypothetical protein NEIG_01400 [Nematocida sp. ERTm5]OAG32715.1 hypothetical protein NEIG_02548 [Nematocida sp. ERTm5]OAG32721.1 hypothetical protein NEIG_02610 [Nematocida sp. ERTm5]OAG32724.1 hypothetical protein NEIG_02591 [Nematocida sp. ERTm5]